MKKRLPWISGKTPAKTVSICHFCVESEVNIQILEEREERGNKTKCFSDGETMSHFIQLSTITCNVVTSACGAPLPHHPIPLLKLGTRRIGT